MHLARRVILHLHEDNSEEEFDQRRKARWGPRGIFDREKVWGVVQLSYATGVVLLLVYLAFAVS